MIKQSFDLWEKAEYTYPTPGGFIPTIHSYIHDEDTAVRPALIVVPGGGYRMVSPTEGEIVALEFYGRGCNTFVVTYTTNLTDQTPLKFQPLKDLSRAIRMVRRHAADFRVDADRVTICGFSAGAHLTGSLAVHYDAPELKTEDEYQAFDNRPNAVILSYPVITSGEYAHRDSFIALLGKDASQEELDYMSLEKHVTPRTPPAFLWQTATDETVPVENSYLYALACKKHGVIYEHHVFCEGTHGLSLANEDWAKGNYGGYYTMDQTIALFQDMVDHGLPLPAPFDIIGSIPAGTDLKNIAGPTLKQFTTEQEPIPAAALWPQMADLWLHRVLNM